jgi:hypothetical protein
MKYIARYSKASGINDNEQTEEERWIAQKDRDLIEKKIAESAKKHAIAHAKESHTEIKTEVTKNKKDTDGKIDALLGHIKSLQSEVEKLKKK